MWGAEPKADVWGCVPSNFLFLQSSGALSCLLRVRPAEQTGVQVTVPQSPGPSWSVPERGREASPAP